VLTKDVFLGYWINQQQSKKPSEGFYDNQKLVVVANDMKFAHHLIGL
jgi:hypothetical protein